MKMISCPRDCNLRARAIIRFQVTSERHTNKANFHFKSFSILVVSRGRWKQGDAAKSGLTREDTGREGIIRLRGEFVLDGVVRPRNSRNARGGARRGIKGDLLGL